MEMVNQSNIGSNSSIPSCSTYAPPLARSFYWIIDSCHSLVSYVAPISEQEHREDLDRLARKVKAQEDRPKSPNFLDTILDAVLDKAEQAARRN